MTISTECGEAETLKSAISLEVVTDSGPGDSKFEVRPCGEVEMRPCAEEEVRPCVEGDGLITVGAGCSL